MSSSAARLAEPDADILAQLRASAARFAQTQPGEGDPWPAIVNQGWLLTAIGEEHGGVGLGAEGLTVIARELGRASLRQPFAAIGGGAALCLAAIADRAPWRERLAMLVDGRIVVTFAWQDSRGGLDTPAVVSRGAAGRIILDGVARFVAAPSADIFIVRTDSGLVWVARQTPGLTIGIERCPDGSTLASVSFAGVAVAADDLLAADGDAVCLTRRALDTTLITCAAELLGIMDGALELTLDYLRARRQFGVAIGSFQVLQHRAVDLWIQRELTEAAVHEAATIFDDPTTHPDRRSAVASGAKARAAEAAVALCNQALQLHGAIGFANEYGLGKLLNRALTLSPWGGNAAQHRDRFAALSPFGETAT